MDQQTVELMCLLQAGTDHQAETWARIEALLPEQRELLLAAKPAELIDCVDLLEKWAEQAPAELAVPALVHAATIAHEDLQDDERAIALYQHCLELDRSGFEAWARLEALLHSRGEHDRIDALLSAQAEAMRGQADIHPGLTANAYQRLGQLRTEQGHLDSAIEAYEAALELDPDNEIVADLAEAYRNRGQPDDLRQAADLYCTLGEVLGPRDGMDMLEQALDLVPAHEDALAQLEQSVPDEQRVQRLVPRWEAYLKRSQDASGLERRREMLASVLGEEAEAEPEPTPRAVAPLYAPSAPLQLSGEPKTLLGIGGPAHADLARAIAAFQSNGAGARAPGGVALPRVPAPVRDSQSNGLRVPPLFLGRVPESSPLESAEVDTESEVDSDSESAPEFEAVWPEQLALGDEGSNHAGDNWSEGHSSNGAAGEPAHEGVPEFAVAPAPSALNELIGGNKTAGRGLSRWALLFGAAAAVGISAGVAIAYGLRSSASSAAAHAAAAKPAAAAVTSPASAPSQDAPGLAGGPTPSAPGSEQANANVAPLRAPASAVAEADNAKAAAAPTADAGEVKVVTKQLKVRGGLTVKDVAGALQGGLAEIGSCYDSALGRKANLRGALKLVFTIDRTGRALRVHKLAGSLKDPTLEHCSVDAISMIAFPKAKARGTSVIAPLAFQSSAPPTAPAQAPR